MSSSQQVFSNNVPVSFFMIKTNWTTGYNNWRRLIMSHGDKVVEGQIIPSVYLQTTPITCGVACVMMVRAAFQGVPPTRELETGICEEFYSRHFSVVPVISLAGYLAREGLDVEAHHQDKQKFWDPLKLDPMGLRVQTHRYEQAVLCGVKLYESLALDEPFLRQELSRRRLVICGTMYRSSGVRHAVLLHSAVGTRMHIIDPLEGRLSLEWNDFLKG